MVGSGLSKSGLSTRTSHRRANQLREQRDRLAAGQAKIIALDLQRNMAGLVGAPFGAIGAAHVAYFANLVNAANRCARHAIPNVPPRQSAGE
jgi:hypothetical protein